MTVLVEPPRLASVVIAWGVFGGRGLGWYVTITTRGPKFSRRARLTIGPFAELWEAGRAVSTLNPNEAPTGWGEERAS